MNNFQLHEFYTTFPVPERVAGYVLDGDQKSVRQIDDILKLNIIIGANNSGKSLLLREMLKIKKLDNTPNINIKQDLENQINSRFGQLLSLLNKYNIDVCSNNNQDVIYVKKIQNAKVSFSDKYQTVSEFIKNEFDVVNKLPKSTPNGFRRSNGAWLSKNDTDQVKEQMDSILSDMDEFIKNINTHYIQNKNLEHVYIPTIRSLRNYDQGDILSKKTRGEYGLDEVISIQNGQEMYSNIQEMMLDTYEIQKRKKDFEVFLSKEFFQEKDIIITPNAKLKELTIKVGDEKERPIYDLGEGLQMIIILTFPIFFYESGIVTIEEPELFLHPGFQHKLINTMVNHPRSSNFIFFVSTHSNHILDSVNYHDKISIFSMVKTTPIGNNLNRDPKFILTKLSDPGMGLLQILGVRNTSVFLSNSTIWVEGITDMLYLRKYLSVYLENLKDGSKYHIAKLYQEGIHYAFILSGGSSIIHYDFNEESTIKELKGKVVTKRICGRSFVIVDKDSDDNKLRKQNFFKDLKGRFKVLPVIEVENLLSNEVIMDTVKKYPTCENLNFSNANLLDEKKFSNIRLGTYIEDYILKGLKQKGRKQFKANKSSDNSTINNKLEFCNYALTLIKFENMSNNSKKLIEEILDFIISKN